MFHTATHSLAYLDTMKMGGWQQTSEWGKGRSPDPILEFFDFCNGVVRTVDKKKNLQTQPICITLLDQNVFNGVGNYLRAEILNRAGLNPFQPTQQVFQNTPKTISPANFSAIWREASSTPEQVAEMRKTTKHDPGLMVLFLARQIQLEVLHGNMNKYGSPEEQAKFTQWLRVYGKAQEVKVDGRAVHCTQEQRLGTQQRDLGQLLDEYPFPVLSGLYYTRPTITVVTQATISGASASASETKASISPSVSFASSSTATDSSHGLGVGSRAEEKLIPLEQISELPIPMLSKLFMAASSLNRQSKLGFSEQSAVRELLIDGHPIAFSAWQVFEANNDEEDFIDTLKRLVIATAPMREARARTLQASAPPSPALAHHLAAMVTVSNPFSAPSTASAAAAEALSVPASYAQRTKRHSSVLASSSASSSSPEPSEPSESSEAGSDLEEDYGPKKKRSAGEAKMSSRQLAVSRMRAVAKKFPSGAFSGTSSPAAHDFGSSAGWTGGAKTAGSGFGTLVPSKADSSASASPLNFVEMLGEKMWLNHLTTVLKEQKGLAQFLAEAYHTYSPPVYPAKDDIFTAFKLCPLDKVKVVILGQDPYHGPGQAHGLCFSVLPPNPPPPSLVNIYKELETDIPGFKAPKHGDLTAWAKQGVFMLNTVLTVFQARPNSHANMGWEKITDQVIRTISAQRKGVIFLLWGKPSMKKSKLIDSSRDHSILTAAHPSPLSAFNGWFGCRHFSTVNTILQHSGETPIDWTL
jgi:uracil-DNA glycosylase